MPYGIKLFSHTAQQVDKAHHKAQQSSPNQWLGRSVNLLKREDTELDTIQNRYDLSSAFNQVLTCASTYKKLREDAHQNKDKSPQALKERNIKIYNALISLEKSHKYWINSQPNEVYQYSDISKRLFIDTQKQLLKYQAIAKKSTNHSSFLESKDNEFIREMHDAAFSGSLSSTGKVLINSVKQYKYLYAQSKVETQKLYRLKQEEKNRDIKDIQAENKLQESCRNINQDLRSALTQLQVSYESWLNDQLLNEVKNFNKPELLGSLAQLIQAEEMRLSSDQSLVGEHDDVRQLLGKGNHQFVYVLEYAPKKKTFSKPLNTLIASLEAYQQAPNTDKLTVLEQAFSQWAAKKPKEFQHNSLIANRLFQAIQQTRQKLQLHAEITLLKKDSKTTPQRVTDSDPRTNASAAKASRLTTELVRLHDIHIQHDAYIQRGLEHYQASPRDFRWRHIIPPYSREPLPRNVGELSALINRAFKPEKADLILSLIAELPTPEKLQGMTPGRRVAIENRPITTATLEAIDLIIRPENFQVLRERADFLAKSNSSVTALQIENKKHAEVLQKENHVLQSALVAHQKQQHDPHHRIEMSVFHHLNRLSSSQGSEHCYTLEDLYQFLDQKFSPSITDSLIRKLSAAGFLPHGFKTNTHQPLTDALVWTVNTILSNRILNQKINKLARQSGAVSITPFSQDNFYQNDKTMIGRQGICKVLSASWLVYQQTKNLENAPRDYFQAIGYSWEDKTRYRMVSPGQIPTSIAEEKVIDEVINFYGSGATIAGRPLKDSNAESGWRDTPHENPKHYPINMNFDLYSVDHVEEGGYKLSSYKTGLMVDDLRYIHGPGAYQIDFHGQDSGHAIAAFISEPDSRGLQTFTAFDPNYGEFVFTSLGSLKHFLTELRQRSYSDLNVKSNITVYSK